MTTSDRIELRTATPERTERAATGPAAIVSDRAATTEAEVLAALHDVIDPELGIDVVELGLVYGVRIEADHVVVTMTLTTPGCPLHGTISRETRIRLEHLPGVAWAEVERVWEPAWTPERMTEWAKGALGWR